MQNSIFLTIWVNCYILHPYSHLKYCFAPFCNVHYTFVEYSLNMCMSMNKLLEIVGLVWKVET